MWRINMYISIHIKHPHTWTLLVLKQTQMNKISNGNNKQINYKQNNFKKKGGENK